MVSTVEVIVCRHSILQCDYIRDNQTEILAACLYALKKIAATHPGANPTLSTNEAEYAQFHSHEGYKLYNIFSAAAPDSHFCTIFREISKFIFEYCKEDSLYVQAWLNCQPQEQLLDWHSHSGYLMHGYICIDPKDTLTEFETYRITNKVGLIYLGDCCEKHRVIARHPFDGYRLTIGFDVIRPSDNQFENMGFIPIFRNI